MDQQNIKKFSEEHVRAINETDDRIRKWTKFQHDYEALRGRLATLPDKVAYEIMVPFTSLAFMPGRLVHTNELLVLLGDNWFAERSAKEAAEIVERRLNVVRKTLSDLEKEKALLTSRHEFTKSLKARAESGKEVEIKEEYDEQKERSWREEHRRRVAAAKKAQASVDKPHAGHDAAHRKADQSAASASCVDYASALARLTELGLQERKRRELLCKVDKSGACSAPAAADTTGIPADTADSDEDDATDATATDASTHGSRLHCHANSESDNAEATEKKRVTFLDEMQHRKSSELSQTGTGNSSDDSDDVASESDTDETEEEVEDEGDVDEAAGKRQSFGEDDGDAEFAVDCCQWRSPGSNPHATIYFSHSRPAEEVLSMEEADDKELSSTSDAVQVSVLSPADVYKLVEGSNPARAVALQPPLLSAVGAISEGERHELKSILKKQRVGDTDGDGSSISSEPRATVQSTGMPMRPVTARPPASAVTTAFGDHVIEREPSSLPSSARPAPSSETVQSSGPQRPMSKFKAQQQRQLR